MLKIMEDSYQALWVDQTIERLEKESLSNAEIERIIIDAIGEFVAKQISLSQLLRVTTALTNCRVKLTPDLKYVIEDLSELHAYKSDRQYIHNILIDVLRKVTHT